MTSLRIAPASTSQSVDCLILKDTGKLNTTAVYNTSGLAARYARDNGTPVAITLVTLASETAAWTSGGFVKRSNGLFRLDVPDAALATGATRVDITFDEETDINADPIIVTLDVATITRSTLAASDILVTPANKLSADASGNVTIGGASGPAVNILQSGLSKPGTAQTITPADTTAATTAQATIAGILAGTNTVTVGGFSAGAITAISGPISTAVQAGIISEVDGQQVLAAIVNAINAADVNLAGLSAATIAAAVWQYLLSGATTTGSTGALLATLSGKLPGGTIGTSNYAGGDTSGTTTLLTRIAGAVPTNPLLATDARLNNLDAPVSGVPAATWSDAASYAAGSKAAIVSAVATLLSTVSATDAQTLSDAAALLARTDPITLLNALTTAMTAVKTKTDALTIASGKVAATVASGDMTDLPATRAAKIDAIDAKTTNLPPVPAAKSDVQVTVTGGGTAISDVQMSSIANAVAGLLSSRPLSYAGPIDPTSDELTIYAGTAYGGANALQWTRTGYVGGVADGDAIVMRLVSATAYAKPGVTPSADVQFAGTATLAGGTLTLSVSLGADDTAGIATLAPADISPTHQVQVLSGSLMLVDAPATVRRTIAPSI